MNLIFQVINAVGDRDEVGVDAASSGRIPVFIGSGIDPDNLVDFRSANGFIIGSYFKEGGNWRNRIQESRVEKLLKAVRG